MITIEKLLKENYLKRILHESIEKHDKLNPKIFDSTNEMLPEVKDKILEIVAEFEKQLKEDNLKINIKDIQLIGSNCNYNYTDKSDLDIHIFADESEDCSDNHLNLIYNAYKKIFLDKYDLKINDIPIELYVEDYAKQTGHSGGRYSLQTGWISKPSTLNIPEIDNEAYEDLLNKWKDKYKEVLKLDTIEAIDSFLDSIYDLRNLSLQSEGEFGIGNLVFKELRNLDYLSKLKDRKNELKSKELSL